MRGEMLVVRSETVLLAEARRGEVDIILAVGRLIFTSEDR